MLRLGKAPKKAMELSENFECAECEREKAPRIHRSSKPKRTTTFGEEVAVDVLKEQLADGVRVAGLNCLDKHTGTQIVHPFMVPAAQVTAEDTETALELGWCAWAGLPQALRAWAL